MLDTSVRPTEPRTQAHTVSCCAVSVDLRRAVALPCVYLRPCCARPVEGIVCHTLRTDPCCGPRGEPIAALQHVLRLQYAQQYGLLRGGCGLGLRCIC